MKSLTDEYGPLLEAASFAARAHRSQLRKDEKTPYVAHVFRVCLIVRHVFGIEDPSALTAALLHDTIEDTTTDRDDVIEKFDPTIAEWVALLTKDKRLPDDEREARYCEGLRTASWQVKVCKLADVFDNLLDGKSLTPAGRAKGVHRSRRYLAALDDAALPAAARRAFGMVQALLAEVEASR